MLLLLLMCRIVPRPLLLLLPVLLCGLVLMPLRRLQRGLLMLVPLAVLVVVVLLPLRNLLLIPGGVVVGGPRGTVVAAVRLHATRPGRAGLGRRSGAGGHHLCRFIWWRGRGGVLRGSLLRERCIFRRRQRRRVHRVRGCHAVRGRGRRRVLRRVVRRGWCAGRGSLCRRLAGWRAEALLIWRRLLSAACLS